MAARVYHLVGIYRPEKMMAPDRVPTPVFQHPAERMGSFFMGMGVSSAGEVSTLYTF